MTKDNPSCFIIMPISTPNEWVEAYKGDNHHFEHVLMHLFIPAIKNLGFNPISPKSTGSDVIHADIIKNLSTSDLVLCDMSMVNPNVFYEFGIRTALDKPVALVIDDITKKIPFDTSIINFHRYNSCLDPWILDEEIISLTDHIREAFEKSEHRNSLWKYFGVTQTGVFSPEDVSLGEKIDYLIREISIMKENRHLGTISDGSFIRRPSIDEFHLYYTRLRELLEEEKNFGSYKEMTELQKKRWHEINREMESLANFLELDLARG